MTPLNLRLAGVFFAERGSRRALALIAEMAMVWNVATGLAKRRPGGARLEQIQRDHVLVSRSGRQEASPARWMKTGQTSRRRSPQGLNRSPIRLLFPRLLTPVRSLAGCGESH